MNPGKTFRALLINTALASVTNSLTWFAITFWVFLETGSVLATSYVAGVFAVLNMLSAVPFGGFVDHHKKKTTMLWSSIVSGLLYVCGLTLYLWAPADVFAVASSPWLWAFIIVVMIGSVTGNLRMIALSTSVSLLFSTDRDKANGFIGMVNGLGFAVTSVISGLLIGYFGMGTVLMVAVVTSVIIILHLLTIAFPEDRVVTEAEGTNEQRSIDLKGTLALVFSITGLVGLIAFTTLNNFLGGVFMALMDAYGLSLVSVQSWGIVLALTSPGFIIGSALVARFGLGRQPLRLLLFSNLIAWGVCMIFPLQASILYLAIGFFVFMFLHPVFEAAEHTVIQTVVPIERQGRVFGVAQSIESMASPVTTFLIGPLATWFFIPFMTTGVGVELIGDWFGTGPDRGMALVFILAGFLGVMITVMAFFTRSYRVLTEKMATMRVLRDEAIATEGGAVR